MKARLIAIALLLLASCSSSAQVKTPQLDTCHSLSTLTDMDLKGVKTLGCFAGPKDNVRLFSVLVGPTTFAKGANGNDELIDGLRMQGVDVDSRCLAQVVSEGLAWRPFNDKFGEGPYRVSMMIDGEGSEFPAVYGTGSTPEVGMLFFSIGCQNLERMKSARNVIIAWDSANGTATIAPTDLAGFKEGLLSILD